MSTAIATLRSLTDIVAEYDDKRAAITSAMASFAAAGDTLLSAVSISGTWGNITIDTGSIYEATLRAALLKSDWLHVWNGLAIEKIASAKDKQAWARSLEKPAPFTLDNIRATLGQYLENPRHHILRGLAEVFGNLDPAFKSHEKMKIGIKGLPKRVIVSGWSSFHSSYAEDKLRDILNALAAVQGQPLVERVEILTIQKDGDALRNGGVYPHPFNSRHEDKTVELPARDVWWKRFKNGNGHLFFGPKSLKAINEGLAEYYGDVIADCVVPDDIKPQQSTDVARDLQYYPTPETIALKVASEARIGLMTRVFDPSCGCGRLLDAALALGAETFGVEADRGRADQARNSQHQVIHGNFLEQEPAGQWSNFDVVLMNPPFYSKHYAKHVLHALRFLKPGGQLVTILPATARYDHGLLDHLDPHWVDLPTGAFSASGTNICTTTATIRKSIEG